MAYDGTLVGSPSVGSTAASYSSTNNAGNFGNAISLNGSSQYVDVSASAFKFTAGTSWTVRGRLRTSNNGLQIAVSLGADNGSTSQTWWIGTNGGLMVASLSGFSGGAAFGSAAVNDGDWHDFELVVTSGTSAVLYVDGVAAGSDTGTLPAISANDNKGCIGGLYPGSGSAGYFFSGQLDDVAVFTSAVHSSGFTPITTALSNGASGLRSVWHFDGDALDTKSSAPTSAALTGPSTGATGVASSNFTITLNSPAVVDVVFTPAGTVGSNSFTPSTRTITAGNSTGTFTDTPASDGTHVISITNDSSGGSISNANTLNYVSSTIKYDLVDTTDVIYGHNIRVLVPNANAAVPYDAGTPTGVIMYVHGTGEGSTALLADSLKATSVDAFLDAGYILCGTDGSNFGNQAGVNDYAALDKYVRNNYNVSNVLVWGQSMGGLAAALVVSQQVVKGVVGLLLTYPILNLATTYAGTSGTDFSSDIDGEYVITGSGIHTYSNKTYGHDPCLKGGNQFQNVPMRFYASASDTVVGKTANTDTFRAIIKDYCRESVVVVCSGTHGDTSHFVPAEYVAFAARCFKDPVTGFAETLPHRRNRPVRVQRGRW